MLEAVSFYFFAIIAVVCAYRMITSPNPVHSALYLVMTMIDLAAVYFTLNAHFIAGVQLIVYAGAVMVLFVMVIMLFDLQSEVRAFVKGFVSGALKIASGALIAGYLIGVGSETVQSGNWTRLKSGDQVTRDLAHLLFDQYVLAFEVLGVLLLVIAIGAVALSRVKGGTHAKP